MTENNEYKTIMVRYYDDGHEDGNVLGEFKTLKTIFEDAYSGKRIVERKDGVIGTLEEYEVSGMYNAKNGGTRMAFYEFGTKEEILSRLK